MSSAAASAAERCGPQVGVLVDAADDLVQRHELFAVDAARQQCLQAVLHADVVARVERAHAVGGLARRSTTPSPTRCSAAPVGLVTGSYTARWAARSCSSCVGDCVSAPVALLSITRRWLVDADLPVAAEGVVPAMATGLVEMAVDGRLLLVDLRLRVAAACHQASAIAASGRPRPAARSRRPRCRWFPNPDTRRRW